MNVTVESELEEVCGQYRFIERNKEPVKNYGQVYLAEHIVKSENIAQINNMFIVPTPNSEQKWVVERRGKSFKCHCGLQTCCHRLAVELKFDGSTGDYGANPGLKRKIDKSSGRKGPEEHEFKRLKTNESNLLSNELNLLNDDLVRKETGETDDNSTKCKLNNLK